MKKLVVAIIGLALLAVLAEAIIALGMPVRQPGQFFAILFSLALVLGAFVALTDSGTVKRLRHAARQSTVQALSIPLLLLIPYFIYAFGTGAFNARGFLKLLAYILVPTVLLLPDRARAATGAGWRDFVTMAALGFPVGAGWLSGIWTYPCELYFFRPLYCVCAGGYAFLAVRNLEDVGYRLLLRRRDFAHALANFVGFAILAIPLGYGLHFIRFHVQHVSIESFVLQFVEIYVTIAIPEEFLFRGILQNFLEKSFAGKRRGAYALAIASVIFGASHLHHAPVPNWRYGIMGTLAGAFYGNAYRERRRLSANAFTHALVDTVWRFWF